MVKVYLFNPEYFFYEGVKEARLDPIRKEPLLPDANHTSRTVIEPPAEQDGYARVFDRDKQAWSQVEDHRGQTVYRKDSGTAQVLKLGETYYPQLGPVPDEFTTFPRPSEWYNWDDQADDWVEDTDAKTALEAKTTKDSDYAADDTSRDAVWDKVDEMTRAEFKVWLGNQVTDQASAKTAIIALALEVARLRRRIG